MSDATENGVVDQQPDLSDSEQQELAEMMAGYEARGGNTPPASAQSAASEEESQQADEAAAGTAQDDHTGQESNQPDDQSEVGTPAHDLAAKLEELKAEVRANASNHDPVAVRKLYGEIGNINRTLQQVQEALPKPAPVKDSLTAAMEEADRLAEEFPELAGPLVTAMKEMRNAAPIPDNHGPSVTPEAIQQEVASRLRAQAVEALEYDHPDFKQVIDSPEFDRWVNSKPADMQARIRNTENPALASKFMTEFKDSQRQQQQLQQQKHKRLEQAITPKGVPQQPAKSKLTEDEEIMAGYMRGAPRPIHKRG